MRVRTRRHWSKLHCSPAVAACVLADLLTAPTVAAEPDTSDAVCILVAWVPGSACRERSTSEAFQIAFARKGQSPILSAAAPHLNSHAFHGRWH